MYEYQMQGETKRKFSVAYVVRPPTETTDALSLLYLDVKDAYSQTTVKTFRRARPISRSALRSSRNCDWKIDSTVILHTLDPVTAYQADQPQWT